MNPLMETKLDLKYWIIHISLTSDDMCIHHQQPDVECVCHHISDMLFFVVWQGINDPGQTQEKDGGRGFSLLPIQPVLPRSDAGSDGVEPAPCFVVQNCQTHYSSRCLMCGTC